MNKSSRHAVAGALIAAILTIGAASGSSQGMYGHYSPLANGPATWAGSAFGSCAGAVLDQALDAYGALVAQLKQL